MATRKRTPNGSNGKNGHSKPSAAPEPPPEPKVAVEEKKDPANLKAALALEKLTSTVKVSMEAFDEIILRLELGEPLLAICRDDRMPHPRRVYELIDSDKELEARFARARDVGFDAMAIECLCISDDSTNDTYQTRFGPALDKEWVMRSKLRVETRLKLLARWCPTRYGEQAAQTNVNVGVGVNVAQQLTPERIQEIAEKKRAAVERQLKQRAQPKALTNGNGNGHHN